MLWFVLAAMTAIAVAIALWSLVFGRSKRDDSHAEVAFYSERRAEIGRDVERGQLPPSEANAALYASTSSRRDGSRRRIAAALVVLILLVVGIGHVLAVGELDVGVITGRLIRLGTRPADFKVDQAGDGQGVVADELGFQAAGVLRRQ